MTHISLHLILQKAKPLKLFGINLATYIDGGTTKNQVGHILRDFANILSVFRLFPNFFPILDFPHKCLLIIINLLVEYVYYRKPFVASM